MERKCLTDEEIFKVIPKSFVIYNTQVNVVLYDNITKGEGEYLEPRYGQWNEILLTIELAKGVRIDGEEKVTYLTIEQIEIAFYHELLHSFEFFSAMDYDEHRTQLFANCLHQFQFTKK